MKTTLLVGLIVAIVGRFLADEIKAWAGWLHKKMRRRAVEKLPASCRERYEEEWESGLAETPGEIFKLIYSVGLLRAAIGIRKSALNVVANSETGSFTLKRLLDVVLSASILILVAPFLTLIALAIKLETRGRSPVFYVSERVGKRGRIFGCIKFCSIARPNYKLRPDTIELLKANDVFFLATEPHVTRIGRFLRRYALDELPQFLNVLRGEMSLVGPIAPIAGGASTDELKEWRELDATPGLTGLMQPKGVKWTMWGEFKIIVKTILDGLRKK
jgi:lipopolysaccharide/colanic/teichoic acid biosynthesis glycosyltransferase